MPTVLGDQQHPQPNPYRKTVTLMSLALNALFFYFCWVFATKLFQFGPQGIAYVRPTDVTAWILLPVFAASALLLGSNVVYQYLNRNTGEVYFVPVFLLNVVQFIVSLAIFLFILNVLTCVAPHLFEFVICV